MNSKKFTPKKNKAQAMVEFAIALPILLMLLYGVLETGRLLFTYSSIVNATRQAVRWGSTTGMGDRGTPLDTADDLANVKRYQDCAGIRASAQRGDFLNVVNDANITITYDTGPGTSQTDICNGNGSYDTAVTLPTDADVNKGRINVAITYKFTALIPKLVPFVTRDINASSARTIIESITIDGPGGGIGKKNTIINILAVPDPSEVGQTVTVTVTITGDGTNTPTGTVDITGTDADCTITLSGGTGSCNVAFTSVGSKNITATYSGDDNYDGGNNVESHTVVLALTNTIITSDTPDPSNVNGTVNVNVLVTSGAWAGFPTGSVTITGADTNCTINNLSNGAGNCLVTFTSAGSKTITATYNGDAAHAGSNDTEAHTVVVPTAGPPPTPTQTSIPTAPPTATAIPLPPCVATLTVVESWSNGFKADVAITNNTSTVMNGWNLTWSFTNGQVINNYWSTLLSQTGSNVSASNPPDYNNILNPNGGTVTFGFLASHSGINAIPTNFTLNGIPCNVSAAVPTAVPTTTFTPIPATSSCALLSHQPIVISAAVMSMIIENNNGFALEISSVEVWWNAEDGKSGGNKDLKLKNTALDSFIYKEFTPNVKATQLTIFPSVPISLPVGSSTISFKFDANYATTDGTEQIKIFFSTPGCPSLDSDN